MKLSKYHTGNVTSLFPNAVAWVLVDEGYETKTDPVLSISDAMGLVTKTIKISPKWPYTKLPYCLWGNPEKICDNLKSPWPAVALAVGPDSSVILAKLRKYHGVFAIVIGDHSTKSSKYFDFFIDSRQLKILPHRISTNTLIEAKHKYGKPYEHMPRPMFLLNPDSGFKSWEIIQKTLEKTGGSLIIHGSLADTPIPEKIKDNWQVMIDAEEGGEYLAKIAMADAFICSAHNSEFISEITSARNPIFVYDRNTAPHVLEHMLASLEELGYLYEFKSTMVAKIMGMSYLDLPVLDESSRLASLIWNKFHEK